MDASPSSPRPTVGSTRGAATSGVFLSMFNRSVSSASTGSSHASSDQQAAATAATLSGLGPLFDRTDFPSLGSLGIMPPTIAAGERQHQLPQQQQRGGYFPGAAGQEVFPSLLSSSGSSGIGATAVSLSRQSSSSSAMAAQTSKRLVGIPQSQSFARSISSIATEKTNGSATASAAPPNATMVSTADYGLIALLRLVRMSDAERNSLALGKDPTLLGWNGDPSLFLSSSVSVFSLSTKSASSGPATGVINAAAPTSAPAPAPAPASNTTAASPTPMERNYQLPICYYMSPPALKTGHFAKFQLETLFYIFYALPRDVLQSYAAQELYHREWRYHTEHKLWFKRVMPSDGVSVPSTGSSSIQYMYFDVPSWERRLFAGSMTPVMIQGFLSEDEVTVKFPSS